MDFVNALDAERHDFNELDGAEAHSDSDFFKNFIAAGTNWAHLGALESKGLTLGLKFRFIPS